MRKKAEKIGMTIENPALFRSLVGDFAAYENRSLSSVSERTILNALLPSDNDMRYFAVNYLFSPDGNVGRTLEAIFDTNSAGLDWKAKHDNYLPFVRFARVQSTYCKGNRIESDEYARNLATSHMASQLRSTVDYLRELSQKEQDEIKAGYYASEADMGEFFYKELKSEPQFFKSINIYDLILHSWEDLKWWQITYRLLRDLVWLDLGWRADPEARLELLSLMKSVPAEWEQQQA